jgi:hypothetical protein
LIYRNEALDFCQSFVCGGRFISQSTYQAGTKGEELTSEEKLRILDIKELLSQEADYIVMAHHKDDLLKPD